METQPQPQPPRRSLGRPKPSIWGRENRDHHTTLALWSPSHPLTLCIVQLRAPPGASGWARSDLRRGGAEGFQVPSMASLSPATWNEPLEPARWSRVVVRIAGRGKVPALYRSAPPGPAPDEAKPWWMRFATAPSRHRVLQPSPYPRGIFCQATHIAHRRISCPPVPFAAPKCSRHIVDASARASLHRCEDEADAVRIAIGEFPFQSLGAKPRSSSRSSLARRQTHCRQEADRGT